MATATSLSEELLTLKEEMGWSWSEMANQVEGALNVKGPSGSTLFRYAKGQANPSDLVEQTVLRAIQTIRENQLAEVEEDELDVESSTVSERSITEIEKSTVAEASEELVEAESEYTDPEAAVETGEAEVSAVDEEIAQEVVESESTPEIPQSPWNAEGLGDVPFAVGMAMELEIELPVSPWNAEGLNDVPFAAGMCMALEVEEVEETGALSYPELEGPTAHGAGIVIDEIEERSEFGIQPVNWASLDTDVLFAHGLSYNPVIENDVEVEDELEVVDTEDAMAEVEEEREVTADNEVVDPVDEEVLLDPDYDIGEAGVLEHFEIDIIMEAQMAFERDEAPVAGLDIAEADQLIEEALVDESELAERAEESAELEEASEVDPEVAEAESQPEPVVDSRELLDSLYENPSRLNTLTPAHYFIFDESLESSQIPTLADLITSAIVEPAAENTELVEVGEINEVGQIEELDAEEGSISENGEEDEEIRLLAPFGEGSLYANGSSEMDPAECPKAREYSARSREILFSLPESE